MDRLDVFSIFGELFPRLAALTVILGLILAPKLVATEVVSVGRVEASRITTVLESVIPQDHRHHTAGGAGRLGAGPGDHP